jgi:hypothetical protein
VNQLGVWVGVIGAGLVLAGNRPLVCWLAKSDFYAGSWTNVWFACWVMIFPFVNGIADLFQLAGRMGKTAFFAMLELPVGALFCWMGYHFASLPGLAAAFAFLPLLIRGPYSLYAGPRYCGLSTWNLCGNSMIALGTGLTMVALGGSWSASGQNSAQPFEFFNRITYLPTWREIIVGVLTVTVGAVQATRCLLKIRIT